MICLTKINKRFHKKIIFKDANLKINSNGIYLIKGKNGVGKTTLLNIIGGFISCRGKVVNKYKRNMSYLFQNSYLIENMRVKEHLERFKIDINILNIYSLKDKLDAYPNELSNGEKQRIAFVLALYSNSNLVLLDEPFSNVDKNNIDIMVKELLKYKKEKIILIVSHEYKSLLNNSIHTIYLKDNKIYLSKTDDESLHLEKVKKERYSYKKLVKNSHKLIIFLSIIFLLLASVSSLKNYAYKSIYEDINNSVDYNKFYLKVCDDIYNNGFKVKKCSNPGDDDLKEIDYGYNYDYLLNYLFTREDLFVVNNKNISLKKGRYPKDFNEVMASQEYEIGEKILINSNVLIKKDSIDMYLDTIELEVVGIYNELNFYNDNNIYLDYDLVDEYFLNKKLINNDINLKEYFINLDIKEYKYLTFIKFDHEKIIFDGSKYEYYTNLIELVDKIVELIYRIKSFVLILSFYYIYKIVCSYLLNSQRSILFLIANSFSKLKLSSIFIIKVASILFLWIMILYVIFQRLLDIYELVYLYLVIALFIIFLLIKFYSRNNTSKLMRIDIW